MSSPSSAPALPHSYDPAALVAAVATVAERSFFAYAEPAGRDCVALATGQWYEASLSFRGPFSGGLTVALPIALAHDLCVSFLGLEPDEVVADPAARDLVGELANMVCGSWLTGLSETCCFELTHPEVRITAAAPAVGVVVAVNDQPAVVVLEIATGEQ